jgi:O-antigen/teichoic acid export membrane protein
MPPDRTVEGPAPATSVSEGVPPIDVGIEVAVQPSEDGGPRRLLRSMQLPLWSGLQVAVQMGVALLSARWLGPGERGDFVLATTIATLLLLVSSVGAGQASRVLLAEPGRWWTWTRFMGLAGLLTVPHVVISATLGLLLLSRLSTGNPAVFLPFVVYSAFALSAHLFREGLHGLGRHRTSMAIDVGNAAGQLVLIAAAHRAGVLSVELALAIGAACYAASVLTQVLVGRAADVAGRDLPSAGFREFWQQSRVFVGVSRFAMVAALGQSFVVNGDRLILGAAGSSAQVGIYAAASSLAQLTWVAPVALTPLLTRRVAEAGNLDSWRRMHRPVLGLTVLLSVAVSVVGWFAIPVLLGDEFAAARSVLPILCLAAIPYASYQFDAAACNGLRDMRTGAVGAFVGCVVLLVCASAGYFVLGTSGVACGVGITYVVMAAVTHARLNAAMRHGRARHRRGRVTAAAGRP